MASLAVTNTLADGTTITAAQHNTNYSDIVTYINNRNSGSATWDACSIATSTGVPLIVNNSSGANDIARFQDNGTNVFVVADGGVVTLANQSAARAYRATSTQSIATGGDVKIQFNAESYDVQSEFDSATNYRFTVTKTGKYLISVSLLIANASANTFTILIYKNGSAASQASFADSDTSINETFSFTDILSLTATDYIEIYANSSAGTDTLQLGADKSFVAIHKIA